MVEIFTSKSSDSSNSDTSSYISTIKMPDFDGPAADVYISYISGEFLVNRYVKEYSFFAFDSAPTKVLPRICIVSPE